MKKTITFDCAEYEPNKYDIVMPLEQFEILIEEGLNQNIHMFEKLETEIKKIKDKYNEEDNEKFFA